MSAIPRENTEPLEIPTINCEWERVEFLVAMAESMRTGHAVDKALPDAFDEVSQDVMRTRSANCWSGLRTVANAECIDQLEHIDLDILALALASEVSPALGLRIHALQPQLGTPHPTLPLLQELLFLEGVEESAFFMQRFASQSPLIAGGLVTLSGQGAYQFIQPGPGVARAVLRRSLDLGPPPGTHLDPRPASWDDLILDAKPRRGLEDYLAWLDHSETVYENWSARRLGGPIALFCGSSGTGKTFAARVIATHLNCALYTLDLGRIMSKYIGETEQNLNQLLDALHARPALLQIDEADALLGKRGDISDARDRYANLEVSHLLSRLERHRGPVILTSNLRGNIDSAFLRRFQVVVEFPSPTAIERAQLWRVLLPPDAPLDSALDIDELGDALNLTGGAIHNVSVFAAMLAAKAKTSIGPVHIARAAYREFSKENRQVRSSELGFLAPHIAEFFK